MCTLYLRYVVTWTSERGTDWSNSTTSIGERFDREKNDADDASLPAWKYSCIGVAIGTASERMHRSYTTK